MSEYRTIKKQGPSPLWERSCPLLIEDIEIVENTTSGKTHVKATVRNVGAKAISVAGISGTRESLSSEIKFVTSLDTPCNPGATFETYSKAVEEEFSDKIDVTIDSVSFTDQTAWSHTEEAENLPSTEKLQLSEKAQTQREIKLRKIYRKNEAKVEAAKDNKTISDIGWWKCSCGAINTERLKCWNCSASKEELIAAQDEKDLEKAADEAVAAEEEKARKAEERKAALQKNKPKIIAGGIAAAVVVILIVLTINVFLPLIHIGSGDSARAQENWDTAISEYEAANGFGESSYYVYYCKCMKAIANKSEYEQAFKDLDQASLNQSAHVQDNIALGEAYLAIGDYEDAIKCYEIAGAYADSSSNIYDAYITAADAFVSKGDYFSAVTLLEKANEYGDAKQKTYETAMVGGEKAFNDGKAGEAYILYSKAGNYGDSAAAKAGADKANQASKLESAEKSFQKGELSAAQEAYSEIPAELTYKGINAGQRQELLSSHQEFVDMCGKFSGSNHTKVTQTSKRYGSWHSWEGDRYTNDAEVKCKITDDGTVTVSGSISFYRYTSYSSISAGVKGITDKKSFNFTTTDLPSGLDIGGNVTISFEDGALSFNYYVLNENEDIYFNYTYEASGTYSKTSSY